MSSFLTVVVSFRAVCVRTCALADQKFDYVLTVCDNAKEICSIFPGHAKRLHQNFEDPAATGGSEEARLAVSSRFVLSSYRHEYVSDQRQKTIS